VARRKSTVILVLLTLAVLLLSPWASAPAPTVKPASPSGGTEALPSASPVGEEPAELAVTAVVGMSEFETLQAQNEAFRLRHPDVSVELRRQDPAEAGRRWNGEEWSPDGADIWLVPNEWVTALAVAGELLPADEVFVGEAISEPFDSLVSQLKWNGYVWAVPRDMDPYVVVWNTKVLSALQAEGETKFSPPLSPEAWRELPGKLAEAGLNAGWLAIDGSDPLALLAWIGTFANRREDAPLTSAGQASDGGALEQALSLLAEARSGIRSGPLTPAFWRSFAAGEAAAVVARNSAATRALRTLSGSEAAALAIDRSAWNRDFVWPGGVSIVLSAKTKHEEAARVWAAEMTSRDNQLQNYRQTGRLPVSRSLYSEAYGIEEPLNDSGSGGFPNEPALASGPEVASRLAEIGALWSGLLDGSVATERWKALATELFADFKRDR